MTPTTQEQLEILSAGYPGRLLAVKTNIDYLRLMVEQWMGGAPWSAKPCPNFADVCDIVLGGDDCIPKDLYGYDEASLRALVTRYKEDRDRYDQAVESAAVAWLWDTLKGQGCEESTPLPESFELPADFSS